MDWPKPMIKSGLHFLSISCPEGLACITVLANEIEVNSASAALLSPFLLPTLNGAVMTGTAEFILQPWCINP